ncbi:uncharacterized protein LOC110821251 [Carica papaya]|uniref:uncharacterized protein LOC110821251 n=1 Tax=Carica papaya TaxID=3649 RepID=UPI000B8C9EF0|nr:uncharacterized protein LOC110821251 [Carica papaya]
MEIAVRALLPGLNSKIINGKQALDVCSPYFSCRRACFLPQLKTISREFRLRNKYCPSVYCAVSGVEEVGVSSSQKEDISVLISKSNENGELKISVEVSGDKTQKIFDNVFDKMVAAAQPIPGFRRVKGGKTPNIPKDILLEVLGPSKVYKQVIKELINSAVAGYVEKEGLRVSKNLRVDQSYEDLEDVFEPGEKFCFDAVLQLHETSSSTAGSIPK